MGPRDPGDLLTGARDRVPLTGHVGKSGATLERARLADGRRVVVKQLRPADDLVMALTGDRVGREFQIWRDGVLDRLPVGVAHAVLDGWATDEGAVLVMRDLADSVLTWDDRLSLRRWLFVVDRVAALHRSFLGAAPTGLTDPDAFLGLFAPARMRPHATEANPLARLSTRGWEIFAETVPADVADPVLRLLDDVRPLSRALLARPTTLVHGDLATVNMAVEDDTLVLLDWSMPLEGPGALDVARFVAGCASVVDVSREQMLVDYAAAAGPAYDETAMRLALLAALAWLGWNKALDAAEHPDPELRARERADLDWWVARGRSTLQDGLLG